jgi:hypothetical protein
MTSFDLKKLQCHFWCGRDDLIAGIALNCQPGHIAACGKKNALGKLFNFDLRCLMRQSHVHDQPQAERCERGFDMFHARSVTQVECASDLRQVPA